MNEVEYLITVNTGLSEVSALEVEGLIGKKPITYTNYLRVNGGYKDAYKLVIWGRTLHRVILVLDEDYFDALDDIGKKVSKLDYKLFYRNGSSFRLSTTRYGAHKFTSIDANRVVGGYIFESLKKLGLEPRVDLENPDIEFVLRIIDDKYILGINLAGEGLHRRMYRVFNHPASIKTSIAASMIILSGWCDEDLIDPMAGGGTIVIEAAMYKYRYAPGLYRASHPLVKLKIFDYNEYMEFREKARSERITDRLPVNIIYNDISRKYLEGAVANASSAGVDRLITFFNYDARRLDKYIKMRDGGIAITNPPYGIRMTRMKVIPNMYRDIISSLNELGVKTVVSITPRWREMVEAYEENGYRLNKRITVLHGRLTTFILIGEQ